MHGSIYMITLKLIFQLQNFHSSFQNKEKISSSPFIMNFLIRPTHIKKDAVDINAICH